MTDQPENPQACSRCGIPATHKQGNQHLCPKHYRFGQMRASAKRHGKIVPTHEELHKFSAIGVGCPDCDVRMNWLAKDGQSTVATLQHYRDGTFGIVCRSCNTRHAHMNGDEYRDMPNGHKQCPHCGEVKPFCEYYKDNGRSGPMKLKSWCKDCSNESIVKWRNENKEHYNATQRENRKRRAG